MKPTLILALAFAVAIIGSGAESRLADPMVAFQAHKEVYATPVHMNAETELPSLFSRWHACLSGEYSPQKSMSVIYGSSYDPNNDHDFLLLSFQWKWTYRDFWGHGPPDTLFFRLEAAGGMRLRTEERGVVSCGLFAQRYLKWLATDSIRPYVDAGTGIIYTDFQNHNQGLRLNFNPRLSFGADFLTRSNSTWFLAFRLFHLSNAGLHEDNRGVNAAMVVIGRNF